MAVIRHDLISYVMRLFSYANQNLEVKRIVKNIIGYRIFFHYLDYIWNSEEHDWLAALLGGMSLLADGSPADPAYEYDWNNAVEKISDSNDSYQAGIQFLKDYLEIGYIEEIGQILSDMEANKRLDLWEKAVYDVEHDLDDPYLRFVSE